MKAMTAALLSFCLLLTSTPFALAETYPQQVARLSGAGGFQSAVEQLLYSKLNHYRASKGLPLLRADHRFTQAARAHALDMAQRNYLGHSSSGGLDFSARMRELQAGKMRFSVMGENAAMMYPPSSPMKVADRLFESWLHSPEHLLNMERRDFSAVATGAVYQNGKAYADQIFVGAALGH